VGFDNIDIAAATRRGIVVTNTPGVLDETTADLAFALMLAVARRVIEGDRVMRAGEFPGWAPEYLLGRDVHSRTIGIVGLGRIGARVARRARGFDMEILYAQPRRADPGLEDELRAQHVALDELLARSDFVSLHAPLNPSTRHLIGARELSLMRPDAVLINTARGPLVDEAALAAALRRGVPGGAGLDVHEAEPQAHPQLAALPNVVLLPHLGSATQETRSRMAEVAARNLVAALAGEVPAHPVNPEALR
jgi:glyoxylate reductase